jgi:4-amino-4-deoxy-L-arabinose transferase-like glycosyltransferase
VYGRGVPASSARLVLIALLLLAAALRLWGLGTMPGFNGDEGYEAYYAWQVGEHLHFRLNPVRPYLGPYFLWLVGPVIAIAGEVTPFVARIVPALGGVLGVAIAWTIGRRWRDESLGLTLATLFAASAWAVSFQRVALSVMMLPVLTLGAVALTLRLWEAPSIRRAGALGAVLGAAAAFHPQGLLLLPVVLVASLLHPRGRAALTPRFVGVVALGFAATSWVVWAMILDQVGLGPGVDYSGTLVTPDEARPLFVRLPESIPVLIDALAGPRVLHWFTGMEPISLTLTWPTRIAAVLMLGRGSLQALRDDEGTGRALLGGFTVALFLTAARAAEFDLTVVSRERYLLVALTLATLVAGYGLASLGRKTIPAVAVVVVLQLGVLVEGFFAPFAHDGGHAEPSMVVAQPDAKLQAARWMLERLGPDEKGLILAGDGWSYWPLVAFTAERMPVDFVPQDPEETAAILQRTTDRRRFLVDFHEWHWNQSIRDGLAAAGYSDQPAFQPTTPNGRPLLTVWELPPE